MRVDAEPFQRVDDEERLLVLHRHHRARDQHDAVPAGARAPPLLGLFNALPRPRWAGEGVLHQPTSVLIAAVMSWRPFFASAKNIPVFGSTYSSLSMPA